MSLRMKTDKKYKTLTSEGFSDDGLPDSFESNDSHKKNDFKALRSASPGGTRGQVRMDFHKFATKVSADRPIRWN